MFFGVTIISVSLLVGGVESQQYKDLFNYGMDFRDDNGVNSYGQDEWDFLSCDDIDDCPAYPNKYPHGYFSLEGDSQCRWCPASGSHRACGLHRQSPIDLKRNRAVQGHEDEKECPDWHWMQYRDDSCDFDDMRDSFSIERHALQIHIPTRQNGDIACRDSSGRRRYPRIDYSKGFPDWWHMARVDVSMPSQHTQDGRQYAAEIVLAHFYEVDHFKNHLGHIGLFMQDYEDEDPWPFLDKLICNWRLEEEKVRESCGLPPALPYGRCRLFRDQPATTQWLREAGLLDEDEIRGDGLLDEEETTEPAPTQATTNPTTSSTVTPTAGGAQQVEPSISPQVYPTTTPVEVPTTVNPPVTVVVPLNIPVSFPVPAPASTAPLSTTPIAQPITETPTINAVPTPISAPIVLKPIVFGALTDEPSTLVPETPTEQPSVVDDNDLVDTITESPSSSPSTVAPTPLNSEQGSSESSITQVGPPSSTNIPPRISCRSLPVSMGRYCTGTHPCCESVRSETPTCWTMYDTLQDVLESACYHCCDSPKLVGPATPENPVLPQTMKCSDVENPSRMCKENSCCSNPRSTSRFCVEQYMTLGDRIDEVCYYCCSEPKEVGPSFFRRNLRPMANNTINSKLPEGAKVIDALGKRFLLRKENFDEDEDADEQFSKMHKEFRRRSLQNVIHDEDYENINWFPYEWMLKVDTEYYFRYEGTMLVPPCWETVHWRFMKDPIRVHPRQIVELNRLLARRRNPETCQLDTAGVRSEDGRRVEVNRQVQYQTSIHRSVFCECKNWPSKFENDKKWCKDYKRDTDYSRFYDKKYNFMVPP